MHKKRTIIVRQFLPIFIVGAMLSAVHSMAFAASSAQKIKCVDPEIFKEHMVLVEENTYGRASAVLYEDDIIISNHTIIAEMNKDIGDLVDVFIAKTGERLQAKIIYSQKKPDLAFLKLDKKIEGIMPLSMPIQLKKTEQIFFTGFTLASEFALNHTKASYLHPAKFTTDSNSYYFEASYSDFALSGDSGGAYFTCSGQLGGVNFGNFELLGENSDTVASGIYAINTRAIERALRKAGLTVRRY